MGQNRTGAALVGIQTSQVTAVVFVLGSAMAGAAGVLYGSLFAITPYMAAAPLMKGFILTVLGGLGSVPGAVLAGFLLGIAESLGSRYLSASFRDGYGFILLIIALLYFPRGLFGQRGKAARMSATMEEHPSPRCRARRPRCAAASPPRFRGPAGSCLASCWRCPCWAAVRYIVYLGTLIALQAALATSLNIVMGYAGQFAMSHAAFYGIRRLCVGACWSPAVGLELLGRGAARDARRPACWRR